MVGNVELYDIVGKNKVLDLSTALPYPKRIFILRIHVNCFPDYSLFCRVIIYKIIYYNRLSLALYPF